MEMMWTKGGDMGRHIYNVSVFVYVCVCVYRGGTLDTLQSTTHTTMSPGGYVYYASRVYEVHVYADVLSMQRVRV